MSNVIKDLEKQISEAQVAYYNGSAIIDDDVYDALIYELSVLDSNNKLLNVVGADPVQEWKKEKHLIALGSLNKLNYQHEMTKWITDNLNGNEVLVSDKLDGLSIGCQYDNGKLVKAVLRGNGREGENIYVNVVKMIGAVKFVPNFTGTVRGEIVLTKYNHEAHFSTHSNPRNAASGICRRLDGVGCEHLTLMFYQVVGNVDFKTEEEQFSFLKKHGFNTPRYQLCKTHDEVNALWRDYQATVRISLDYEIDGLVVSCNDFAFQDSLGTINLRPKGKMAFKFANQFIGTTVKDITWSVGNSGRVTPICWFDPVNLLGSTIEKASVYNIAYIDKLGLGIGAKVLICKANEVIPRVEKVITAAKQVAQCPANCPVCDSNLEMSGENLTCPNTDNCSAQLKGRIKNWIKDLNILEWGDSLIDKLVDTGKAKNIADLYSLTINELASIDRMGQKSAKKCYDNLWAESEVALDVFIGGLSIPLIGSSTIRLIMKSGCDTLEKFGQLSAAEFEMVPGIGPTRAQSLAKGLKNNQQMILDILSKINIKKPKIGALSNKSVCFTGTLSMKRADLEKLVIDNGGALDKSCTKNTSFLVMADANSTSSKAVSARKNGTTCIDEDEFLKLLK